MVPIMRVSIFTYSKDVKNVKRGYWVIFVFLQCALPFPAPSLPSLIPPLPFPFPFPFFLSLLLQWQRTHAAGHAMPLWHCLGFLVLYCFTCSCAGIWVTRGVILRFLVPQVKLAVEESTEGPPRSSSKVSRLIHAKFHLKRCRSGVWVPNWNFYVNFGFGI